MFGRYRLGKDELLMALEAWNTGLRSKVLVVACGGTALTLYGHKESTKDVDFLVPIPEQYTAVLNLLGSLGYKNTTGYGYLHPNGTWLFEIYKGQTIFQTELLDPVHEEGKHRVIREYGKLTVACLNPDDLIISKMFRGTQVDVEDSVLMMKSESIDMENFAQRFKETADYYYNPPACKKNLAYLIEEMDREGMNAKPLKDMSDKWNP